MLCESYLRKLSNSHGKRNDIIMIKILIPKEKGKNRIRKEIERKNRIRKKKEKGMTQ